MKSSSLLSLFLGFAAASVSSRDGDASSTLVTGKVSKSFIVEVEQGVDAEALSAKLTAVPGTSVIKVFTSSIFRGFSVSSDSYNVETLGSVDGVVQVWSSMDAPEAAQSKTAPTLVSNIGELSTRGLKSTTNYSIHGMTGVDKLHAKGIYGKGAVVALVDGGIDYTHPALGGCFGRKCKVKGGYDFVGDVEWPHVSPVPDKDPMDEYGLGTAYAGIVAGKSDWYTGVAPEATILAYKVAGTNYGTSADFLIEAFLQAYEDGADVIHTGMTVPGGWSQSAYANVLNRIVEKGVVITMGAGNRGSQGLFSGDDGVSAPNVLAVAAVDSTIYGGDAFTITSKKVNGRPSTVTLGYQRGIDAVPTNVQGWPIVPFSFDIWQEGAACEPLSRNAPDFSGSIVLIRQTSDCYIGYQVDNLVAHGAKVILFYYNEANQILRAPVYETLDEVYLGTIEPDVAVELLDILSHGGSATANFSEPADQRFVSQVNAHGGAPIDWDTFWPTPMLEQKPEIAAPGVSIFTTYRNHEYTGLTGSQVSAAYVAGIAALYVGKYGGRKVHGPGFGKDLSMRIMSSGKSLPFTQYDGYANNDLIASTTEVGCGLVDAVKVLAYDTQLSWAKFALNDTHHFERYHSVDITNNAKKEITYKFSLQPAVGFHAWLPYDDTGFFEGTPRLARRPELSPFDMVPTVHFPSGTFKVKPGQTKTASINFDYPRGLDPSLLPVYSGKILISGSNGDELAVPYMGMAANFNKDLTEYIPEGYPYFFSGGYTDEWPVLSFEEKNWFTFNLSMNAQDFLKIDYTSYIPTQELRFDIFESGFKEHEWKYPPVPGRNKYVGSAAVWREDSEFFTQYDFIPGTHSVNATFSFPLKYTLYRQTQLERYNWMGRLANGSFVTPGKYSIRFASLRPFGTPGHSDNWDIYEPREIRVLDTWHLE